MNDDWLSFGSSALTAQVDPLGAQLSTLRDAAGLDLLWDGNAVFWNGRAPLLFPIVGALAGGVYRIAGRTYALSRHGFARGKPFEVLRASASGAELRLQADAQTLGIYPFDFELRACFEVDGACLRVISSVRNHGDAPMPASFGYHPAFRWPLPYGESRARHTLEFEFEEPAPIRRLDADGLVTPLRHPTPIRGRRLLLDDALFKDDVMILDAVRSRRVSYGADSGPRLTVQFPDTPYLGLWTKPAAPFVCIEPWHGMADPEGFTGEFTDKPGVFVLAPGAERKLIMQVTLSSP